MLVSMEVDRRLEERTVAVLVANFYEDLELWVPALGFREEGARVTLVGPKAERYTSNHGYPVQADVAADQVKGADFEAVSEAKTEAGATRGFSPGGPSQSR